MQEAYFGHMIFVLKKKKEKKNAFAGKQCQLHDSTLIRAQEDFPFPNSNADTRMF